MFSFRVGWGVVPFLFFLFTFFPFWIAVFAFYPLFKAINDFFSLLSLLLTGKEGICGKGKRQRRAFLYLTNQLLQLMNFFL